MDETSNSEKISVYFVIPTLNEEENLPLLLSSISEQELEENIIISNIIVVDNGSQDKTLEIANYHGASVFSKPDYSIADLRNYGAKMTVGDVIIFSDADNILNKDVVNNVVLLLSNGHYAALGPDGLVPSGNATWLQKIWYFHTSLLSEQKQIIETDNLSSGFFAIKACVFGEIDGFNGSLSIGEDSEISYRLRANGYRLAKSNKIIVYNSGHPKTVRQFVRREIWHGDSFKHLMMHKNVDLLTIYFIVNCLLWASLILGLIYIKSYGFIFTNIAFIVAVPIYKAIIKVKGFNNNLLKLIVIYTLYAASRSLALFKLR